jgi:hypothetical protein
MSAGSISERLARHGVLHVPGVLDEAQLGRLWERLRPDTSAGAVRAAGREVYGARGLLVARPWLVRTHGGWHWRNDLARGPHD